MSGLSPSAHHHSMAQYWLSVHVRRRPGSTRLLTAVPTLSSFPTRGALRRPQFSSADLVVGAGIAVLLYAIIRLGHSMNTRSLSAHVTGVVSTRIANLPYYAARSLLRMFIALGLSVAFTFVYATAAARSRRARVVLIPLLDILQSVPILGFLTITVTFFVALFPGSTLGLECAAIFAIFTSQAWNMTFSMYHSLITQPPELDEAARMFRLTKWERFWHLDVPSSMIGLVWNGMMSFGGGWFFLAASELISVANHSYALPGIGSYVATAALKGDLPATLHRHRGDDRDGHRRQRGLLASARGLGREVPGGDVRGRGGSPQRHPGPAAPLPCSRAPSGGLCGRSDRASIG